MNKQQSLSFLQGEDRIEHVSIAGRTIRIGDLTALKGADLEQVRTFLRDHDARNASQYLTYLHPLYLDMIASYVEWALSWTSFVADHLSVKEAHSTRCNAHQNWVRTLTTLPGIYEAETVELLTELLDPARENKDMKNLAVAANELPDRCYTALRRAIQSGFFDDAANQFEDYILQVRERHDLLATYVWIYASTVNQMYGQAFAEDGLQNSLANCAFYEEMWDMIKRATPVEITVLMAEELRLHFSGQGRQGAVEIIEESDRYRLVFDPCGSGGAMRRRGLGKEIGEFSVFTNPSPATWGQTGVVPAYCAHCAQNELESYKRLGYPAWVTDFDPDPDKPCGWIIYKDSSLIPEKYFVRLGLDREFL